MDNEKVALFMDHAYLNRDAIEKGYSFDYQDLLAYVGKGRSLSDVYGYLFVNPRYEYRLGRDVDELWRAGYLVHTKMGSITGGQYHCNFEVEITMDVLRVLQQVKPACIVLVTDDVNFVPLIQLVREAGVRVEVAGFEESIDEELLLKCSGFIDLKVYYEGYLAAHRSEAGEEGMEKGVRQLHEVFKEKVDQEDDETSFPGPDNIDLGDKLKVTIVENGGKERYGD